MQLPNLLPKPQYYAKNKIEVFYLAFKISEQVDTLYHLIDISTPTLEATRRFPFQSSIIATNFATVELDGLTYKANHSLTTI